MMNKYYSIFNVFLMMSVVYASEPLCKQKSLSDEKEDKALHRGYGFYKVQCTNSSGAPQPLTSVGVIAHTNWLMLGTRESGITMLNTKNMQGGDLFQDTSSYIKSIACSVYTRRVAFSTKKSVAVGSLVSTSDESYDFDLVYVDLPSAVNTLAFDPTDSTLAGGCNDGSVCLWDIRNAGPSRKLPPCSAPVVPVVALAYLDSNTVCYNAPRAGVVIDDTRGPKKVIYEAEYPNRVQALSTSIAHRLIVTGGADGVVRLLDMRNPKIILKLFATHDKSPITSLAFHPSRQEFSVGQENGSCCLRWVNAPQIGFGHKDAHSGSVSAIVMSELTKDYCGVSVGSDGIINFHVPNIMPCATSLTCGSTKDQNKPLEESL